MAAVLDNFGSPECGKSHNLCWPDADVFSISSRYEYACPINGRRTIIRPTIPNTIMAVPPAGALTVKRVDFWQ